MWAKTSCVKNCQCQSYFKLVYFSERRKRKPKLRQKSDQIRLSKMDSCDVAVGTPIAKTVLGHITELNKTGFPFIDNSF